MNPDLDAYHEFLRAKSCAAARHGFECQVGDVSPVLRGHQAAMTAWAVRGGRRALFASFGLGKTLCELQIARLLLERLPGRALALIVIPLGIRQEFFRDAEMVGERLGFIRHTQEINEHKDIYLTNYESVREGLVDPAHFQVCILDEAAVLRSFGSKTFGEMLFGPMQRVPYRFVATATPAPNDYLELIAYAHFLGVMDMGESKTRFFRRNSEKSDDLTLHPHKTEEFWLWVSTWALFVQKPSDLGFSDEGYELPELDVRWHCVGSDHREAGATRSGQGLLLKDSGLGVVEASREKKSSLGQRTAKLLEIRAEDPGAHRILWHDREDERAAIEKLIPTAVTVYGAQPLDKREASVIGFSDGTIRELAGKPVMLGSGCNFQRHCHWAIYLGIGFKFNDFIQSVHRLHRFLQTDRVRIDLIYTEAEACVRETLERKWRQHEEMCLRMSEILREFGLAEAAAADRLERALGCERIEEVGPGWAMVKADAVEECASQPDNSVDLIVTSIPFSSQYEYTPSYNDFGHTDGADHFWRQMDFLTPSLLRVLRPGRVLAVHVKDRVVPGAITGLGYQTLEPFAAETLMHFRGHGFSYMGTITVATDVVRENNQTYRLSWSEQCKDGSRMGCGLPEYVVLLRKPPTDSSDGYADEPVWKDKADYGLARWQLDAHGFWRSDGDRYLSLDEIAALPHREIYRIHREASRSSVYSAETHRRFCEALERAGKLPRDFMLAPPQSAHPDVWTDVTRMRSLNSRQGHRRRALHLCPLPIDIVDRLIERFSAAGETVADPFAGVGTVPLRAHEMGRMGWGCELNGEYFADAVFYLRSSARETPRLFDLCADAQDDEFSEVPA